MTQSVAGLLLDAATLMVIGMSVVFLFLAALIGAVNLIAWLAKQFPESAITSTQQGNTAASSNVPSAALVAVITAAIQQHRANK